MSDEPIPADRRLFAIRLLAALQITAHLAVPIGLAFSRSRYPYEDWLLHWDVVAIGACTGQSTLAAIWLGLRPAALVRTPTILLTWALSVLILVSVMTYDHLVFRVQTYIFTFSQVVVILASLLVFRRLTNRQLIKANMPRDSSPSYQFSLKHVLLWITGIAVLFAGNRLSLRDSSNLNLDFPQILHSCLICAVPIFACALLAYPVLWSAFSRRFVVAKVLLVTTLPGAIAYLVSLHPYGATGSPIFDFEYLLLLNGCHGLWLLANLLLLRLAGYRLERMP